MGVWAKRRQELKEGCKDENVILPSNLLLDSGVIMKGEMNMNDNRITTLADPLDQYDAIHKEYVQTRDDLNLKLNEVRQMQTHIDMGNHNIYNVKDVILGSSSDTHAINKKYVDSTIKMKNDLLETYIFDKEKDILLKMENDLKKMEADIKIKIDDETRKLNDELKKKDQKSSMFLKLDGTNSMNEHLNMDNHRIEGLSTAVLQTDAINLDQMNRALISYSSHMLNVQNGGNLFGNLNMKHNKILNLLYPPINDNECVTKKYVDEKHLILNFAVRTKNDAPPPFNGDPTSVSGFYGYAVGNGPIYYGVSMSPFICANYFEYFPSGSEKVIINSRKVNFVDLSRNNIHTIFSGYGAGLTRFKNQIILKGHILHKITVNMFFENQTRDIEYSIQISQNSQNSQRQKFYGFNGHSKFNSNAFCCFGDLVDRYMSIIVINASGKAMIEHIRVKIEALGAYKPGYFTKF